MCRQRSRRTIRARLELAQVLQALIAVYQLLRSHPHIDDVLDAILSTAIRTIPGVQRGSILVREGDVLQYRATAGYDLAALQHVQFPIEAIRMLIGDTRVAHIQSFTAWDARHLDADTYTILQTHGHIESIRHSLLTPIIVEDQFYGLLVLDNLQTQDPFPKRAEHLATIFAEQAGTLLAHALAQTQLHRSTLILAESERLAAIGRLVSGVAHEINNPLASLLGYAQLLADRPLAPDERMMVTRMIISAKRIGTITGNLLTFARQQHHGHCEYDLNALVCQTVALEELAQSAAEIETVLDLAPSLPLNWGDAGQLSQVLLNLLINARQALSTQRQPRRIQVRTWSEVVADGTVLLGVAVTDNGVGIATDVQAHIFEPFFTTKGVGEGTGLGLSVCYGIVQAHSGTMSVESVVGQGATFLVLLPLRLPSGNATAGTVQPDDPKVG